MLCCRQIRPMAHAGDGLSQIAEFVVIVNFMGGYYERTQKS